MKIGVLCQYDRAYQEIADITVPVLEEYCARYGYDLNIEVNPPLTHRDIVCERMPQLLSAIQRYDWVVHIDTDVLITNLTKMLEPLLQRHVVMPRVLNDRLQPVFNDGFCAFRNSLEGRTLLQRMWDFTRSPESIGVGPQGAGQPPCGQDAFEVLFSESSVQDVSHIVDGRLCNGFLFSEYGCATDTTGQWMEGDFILHLPGMKNSRRVELLKEYLPKVVR